ncbi:MAG: cation transporter [Euryarchaeota archaeon]|nr:cation transporter [Euryarchaeota archaeon]
MDRERYRAGERASLVGVFGNAALAVLKFVTGVAAGSAALVADALDSLSDAVSSLITWLGMRISQKPADETHPYGHYDAEAIAGLIGSMMLLLLAYELAGHAISRLIEGPREVELYAALVVVLNLAAKAYLSAYTRGVARRIRSPALAASAANFKGDVYTSLAILAGIVANRQGLYLLDPLIALGITLLIFRTAVEIGWKNILNLMGTVPSPEMVRRIEELTREVEGVIDVHRVRVHAMGAYNKVDLHVCVDEDLPLREAHRIAHEVQVRITERIPEVASALVHVEPYDEHHRKVHFNNKK